MPKVGKATEDDEEEERGKIKETVINFKRKQRKSTTQQVFIFYATTHPHTEISNFFHQLNYPVETAAKPIRTDYNWLPTLNPYICTYVRASGGHHMRLPLAKSHAHIYIHTHICMCLSINNLQKYAKIVAKVSQWLACCYACLSAGWTTNRKARASQTHRHTHTHTQLYSCESSLDMYSSVSPSVRSSVCDLLIDLFARFSLSRCCTNNSV